MKAKDIRELINFIASSGLEEVNIETEEIKLHVKKTAEAAINKVVDSQAIIPQQVPVQPVVQQPAQQPQVVAEQAPASNNTAAQEESDKYITIKSPMIGTFYSSANPEADAFAQVGDTINKGQVVCIIEAMKLFNEIESEISGKVVKVLVENSSPVEYDQPLFLVDPS
ncbi:acetyl-CoA carboxylase biotin carboxyl carrier protein [Rapidithrix thailandica]|uniref:Biotin carboxyl carrier protein of acetyl-CoA carboxylase n=1 Tax=Rapidithrix thailandica TaxID=413964 RepID=A0AAW9S6Z7_9BACT